MKMCQRHWDMLRTAIDKRGLSHLVPTSGKEAVERMASSDAQKFDPLMSANFAILGNAMERAGLAVMQNNDDGSERCPLCFLGSHCEECAKKADGWVDLAADGSLKHARESGLLVVDPAVVEVKP